VVRLTRKRSLLAEATNQCRTGLRPSKSVSCAVRRDARRTMLALVDRGDPTIQPALARPTADELGSRRSSRSTTRAFHGRSRARPAKGTNKPADVSGSGDERNALSHRNSPGPESGRTRRDAPGPDVQWRLLVVARSVSDRLQPTRSTPETSKTTPDERSYLHCP